MEIQEFSDYRKVTLTGDTSARDIAAALKAAFQPNGADYPNVLWNVDRMNVTFSLNEIETLIEHFQQLELPDIKFAFVVGDGLFMRSVIDVVRSSREAWSTSWKSFESESTALNWLAETPR